MADKPITHSDLERLFHKVTADRQAPPKTPQWKSWGAIIGVVLGLLTLAGTGWKVVTGLDSVVSTTAQFKVHTVKANEAFEGIVEELRGADKDRALMHKDIEQHTSAIDELKQMQRRRRNR